MYMNLQRMRYRRNVNVGNLAGSTRIVTRLRSEQCESYATELPKYMERQPSIRCVQGTLPPEIRR
jgi:hypothetical protein